VFVGPLGATEVPSAPMSEEEKDPPPKEETPADEATPAEDESAPPQPSSPWPSARKAGEPNKPEAAAASAPAPPAAGPAKAAWGAPLDRLDKAWTKLDARLCAAVLLADAATLVVWISLKSLSNTGTGGAGRVFRSLLTALVFGGITHVLTRKRTDRHEGITTGAVILGLLLGTQWGNFGVTYVGNLLAWLQNASFLVFFGGASDVAKRLTLWLALLGASVATGQGKHINVDVVMRFLTPRARVPVAVLGWMVAAVVCFAGVWGFFDHVAVVDFKAPVTVACPGAADKDCPAPPSSKIDFVWKRTKRDLFLSGRQMSLDLKTLPKVLAGAPYAKWMTGKEWNEWLREGNWGAYFDAADIKAMEMDEQDGSFRTPAVTAIPGAGERVFQLLVRECNFVFAFGLLVIGLRFVLRSLLAISGWVKVDPNTAHGEEDLEDIHDAEHHPELVESAVGGKKVAS
jgi:TRAP-type C4-dicarboxylate transport system permease small subunit